MIYLKIALQKKKKNMPCISVKFKTHKQKLSNWIAICGRDQKQLFHITKNIMGDTGTTKIPSCLSPGALAQRFSDHFTDKVRHIRQEMCDRDDNHSSATRAALSDDVCFDGVPLINFMPITESDVERLVAVAPCKTCELDPIHTWLLKQWSSELVPLITTIINASLTKSVVPPDFKRAVIRPLLKKSPLDKDGLQNYRPVSNLPFASKLVEKVVARQMNDHVDWNTLRDKNAICIPFRPLDRNRTAANQERYRWGTRPKEHGYTCDARFVKRIRHDRARSLAYSA